MSDREAYEAARAVLTEKGIDGIPGFDSLVAPGDTILTHFGYDDDGVAIFAVLPEDLPSYDGWAKVLMQRHPF